MIEREIKPRIASLGSIDTNNTALFGHSLGGLAVVHALFRAPDRFRSSIAVSPSIRWHNRSVLADEAGFADRVWKLKVAPRVLIEIGGTESDLLKRVPNGSTRSLSGTMRSSAPRIWSRRRKH